jgi:ArsR family transcriptional regulator
MIDTIKISKILSDPIRYKILLMLLNQSENETSPCCPGPAEGVCNCEIMAAFGMIQSRVSYHMKELVETGLVGEIPDGKWKYYFLNKGALKDYVEQLETDFNL